ncbi:MAG: ThiF family adenylyltransferase [Thermoplasmata archaeon]|nr:MAG: ThiF family adenylyltransferase [Thermoplasmata archaeon]
MPKGKITKIKVKMPGVEEFELENVKESDLKNAICDRLGIEESHTNLIFKRTKKEVIVDYLWARQQIQIGREGQQKLRNGRCVVVGVGALGNELVRNLVLMGIGHITLIDFDKVELSNLNRSLYTHSDIGKNKAEALAAIMNQHYPYAELKAIPKRVERVPHRTLKDADVIISGLDSMLVRIWLADFSIKHQIPLIDGGLKGLMARVQVWTPGSPCMACEIPPENYAEIMDLHDSCEALEDAVIPAFPTISSLAASIQANEAMKVILDKAPMSGVLIIDMMAGKYTMMQLDRNPNCIVCKGK